MEAGTPAIEAAGHHPTGNPAEDEKTAIGPLTAKTPLGVPWIAPEDIAPLVVFLASDAARMVTGSTFAAPGGDSAHLSSQSAGRGHGRTCC
jgi:NAD(P)-dependent dehydrogenase (short-subunit alcohol dehydrogenase family)